MLRRRLTPQVLVTLLLAPGSKPDANWVRVQGYNTLTVVVPVGDAAR